MEIRQCIRKPLADIRLRVRGPREAFERKPEHQSASDPSSRTDFLNELSLSKFVQGSAGFKERVGAHLLMLMVLVLHFLVWESQSCQLEKSMREKGFFYPRLEIPADLLSKRVE